MGVGVFIGVGAGVWPGASVGVGVAVPPDPDVGVGIGVWPPMGVGVGVDACTGVGVAGAVALNQLVLFPLFVELEGFIMIGLRLFESFTSTNEMFLVPCGFTSHCVPGVALLKSIRFPVAPVSVHVPAIVCVLPASKLSCLPGWVQVKFVNELLPVILAAAEPVKTTLPPVPPLNVPVFVQLPPRLIDPVLVCKAPALITSPEVLIDPAFKLNL